MLFFLVFYFHRARHVFSGTPVAACTFWLRGLLESPLTEFRGVGANSVFMAWLACDVKVGVWVAVAMEQQPQAVLGFPRYVLGERQPISMPSV